MADKKMPAPQRAGTETSKQEQFERRQERAIAAAEKAIAALADDREALRLFVGYVAIIGNRTLRG